MEKKVSGVTYAVGAMQSLCDSCKWANYCKDQKHGTADDMYKSVINCKSYELEIKD